MTITYLPPESPEAIRIAAGFSRSASFYRRITRRPAAFSSLQGRPLPSDGRSMSTAEDDA